MHSFRRVFRSQVLPAGICALLAAGSLAAQVSVRTVKVLGSKDAVEIEVEASDRIVPQTQVLSGPDRLVVDFPNSVPSSDLRSQSVDRGQVKDVRVGLFQSRPPVTRVVVDLKSAQSYQVFPYGRTVMIKVMGGATEPSIAADNDSPEPVRHPGLIVTNYSPGAGTARVSTSAPEPALDVTYRGGLLGIRANKATLSEVLYAVQQRTGAEVSIAAGAEQERIVADIAPAPAAEVLARLLNGSKFNFLILSAVNDPQQLDRVILTTRPEPGFVQPTPAQPYTPPVQDDESEQHEPSAMNIQPGNHPPGPTPAPPQPDPRTASESSTPDQ